MKPSWSQLTRWVDWLDRMALKMEGSADALDGMPRADVGPLRDAAAELRRIGTFLDFYKLQNTRPPASERPAERSDYERVRR